MAAQSLFHDLETQQRDVLPAVGAERERNDLRAHLERVGHLLGQVRFVDGAEFGERPGHPHLGLGRHGPRDAGHERPMTGVGKDAGRVAADRILLLALDAFQPRVLGVRARQQAAVENRHQDALAVARLGGHARVGRRAAGDLLRLRGRTVGGDADVEDVIGGGHPLTVHPVHGGAGLLHAPAFVGGELQPGQAAQVVVVRNGRAGHNSLDPVDVGVTNQQGAIPVEVVDVVGVGPVGRVSRRAFQAVQHIGDAGHDQAELRVETASRPSRSVVANRHADLIS